MGVLQSDIFRSDCEKNGNKTKVRTIRVHKLFFNIFMVTRMVKVKLI